MKYFLFILTAFVSFQACRRDNTDDALTKDNKIVAERLFEAYNKHNWDSVSSFYTDTTTFLTSESNNVSFHKTKAAIKSDLKNIEQTIPDIRADILGIYNYRNKTIIEYTLAGTTIEQNKVLQQYCLIWTLKNRKITSELIYKLQ